MANDTQDSGADKPEARRPRLSADAILDSLSDLVNVEIVTSVSKVSRNGKQKWVIPDEALHCYTRIDLLQGDISQSVDPDLLADKYQAIRDLHRANSERGLQIVNENIAAARALAELLIDLGGGRGKSAQ